MKRKWWQDAIIYQVYLRSFKDSNNDGIGDFNGLTSKLDYLKDLGIDAVWVSPHYDSPMDDNGYDIRDYYKVSKEYGTIEIDLNRNLFYKKTSNGNKKTDLHLHRPFVHRQLVYSDFSHYCGRGSL